VERALRQAQDSGLSYRKIHERSGIATSTIHRWQTRQAKTLPTIDKVKAFAAATGASVEDAMQALGMTDSGPVPTPEPPLPDDVRKILRRLGDPNTPEAEREFIRMSLQMLANRVSTDQRQQTH
jgi:transcriptional regulator with XRE-family HTH domain